MKGSKKGGANPLHTGKAGNNQHNSNTKTSGGKLPPLMRGGKKGY